MFGMTAEERANKHGTGGLTTPRYIDADAMIRKICGMKCGCERYECGYDEAGCPKVRDLETAPTVSHDEVRGVGKWIERDDYDLDIYYECSVCHTPFTMLDGTTPELNDYHYCPNCGAKMEVSEDA